MRRKVITIIIAIIKFIGDRLPVPLHFVFPLDQTADRHVGRRIRRMLADFPYGYVKQLCEGRQHIQTDFAVVVLYKHFSDQRSGDIDAELLLKSPCNSGVVQFDTAQLVLKGLFPFYEPLFDEAGIGVVRIVDILYALCVRIVVSEAQKFLW